MGKQKSGGKEDVKNEQKLQAILLADSFFKAFGPITHTAPKVLLPLVNVPMLDYTLEFLISSGVEEVFVFCVAHGDAIAAHVAAGLRGRRAQAVEVHCIEAPDCGSVGEALREIDQRGVVRSDPFVLVSGDVISNINLKPVIEEHRRRKQADPTAVMTMVLKEVGPAAAVRPVADDLVVGLDARTGQVVHFEDDPAKAGARVPFGILVEHPELELRGDLMDCHVDVCSPEVLVAFSDNFDYQELRRDYVRLEAANFELGNRLFAHVVGRGGYAARVHDPRTYAAVAKDILNRWTYPLVPDANFGGAVTRYARARGHVYREHGALVPRSTNLGKGIALGSGVTIGENVTLESCTIGRGCTIGSNATIKGAYVWENVAVGEGARIENAIVCSGAVVNAGATVPRGCLVSFGVTVGQGRRLPEFTQLGSVRQSDQDDFEDDNSSFSRQASSQSAFAADKDWDAKIVGEDGSGYVWHDKGGLEALVADCDSDEEAEGGGRRRLRGLDPCQARLPGCWEQEAARARRWRRAAAPPAAGDQEEAEAAQEAAALNRNSDARFHAVVKDMVRDAMGGGAGVDNLLLEIKSFKFAQNKTFAHCAAAAAAAVLGATDPAGKTAMQIVTGYKNTLATWGELISKLCVEDKDQMAVIKAIEKYVVQSAEKATLIPLFRLILQLLYDAEVLAEDTLLEWADLRRSGDQDEDEEGASAERHAEVLALFQHPQTQEFVTWLEEEDDDDDDESGSSDDGESGSEEESDS